MNGEMLNINQQGGFSSCDPAMSGQPAAQPAYGQQTAQVAYGQQGVVPVQGGTIQPMAVQNQVVPVDFTKQCKTSPVTVTCPYCGKAGMTRVDTRCNWGNCCCCWLTGCIPWCCFQCCRDKALSCKDADHFCSSCGKQIASYTAC